jgi:transposase
VTEAKENNLALSPQDCQLLLDALVTLASMQDRLASHDVTVHKLRKWLGIEKSSEKLSQVFKTNSTSKKKNKKPMTSEYSFTPVKPTVVVHPLTDVAKGYLCDKCERASYIKPT